MRKKILIACGALLIVLLAGLLLLFSVPRLPYGFARAVSTEEAQLRTELIHAAQEWLGANEADGSHRAIVDRYNAHLPLAQGYTVSYSDSWCAAFVSAAAMESGLTDIIPTECSCQRQIALFESLGCWQEEDAYLPLPGDYIYYAWEDTIRGDCTGWADHVGIVVGTWGPFIQVLEGNKEDAVGYRYILRNDPRIRGYGLPDYAAKSE